MLIIVETNDLGSAFLYFQDLPGHALRGHRACALRGRRPRAVRGGAALAYTSIGRVGVRIGYVARPVGRPAQRRLWPHQALYSIGNGGFGGTGLGRGTLTSPGAMPYIPYLDTDFIFAALTQELGLVGIAAFLLVFRGALLRGFQRRFSSRTRYKLLAVVLTVRPRAAFIIVGSRRA